MTASESVVAQGLGFSDWQDIKAGKPASFSRVAELTLPQVKP